MAVAESSPNPPLVSIGFPVYNGGQDFRIAMDALLAQTYPHFELIISDNNSTDGTWEDCQEYAARDSRIKLYRNEKNLGGSYNFSRVLELASGKYFMWAAHDDSWHPDCVKQSVAALEAHPEAMLCYSDQLFIDSRTGKQERKIYSSDLQNPRLWQRAYCLLTQNPIPYATIYGLFRREAIQAALPIPTIAAADLVTLLRVILQGRFVYVPAVLYQRGVRIKEFEDRMKSLLPDRRFLSSTLLFTQLLGMLWKIIWQSGENLPGKIMMTWGATRFVLPRMLFQSIPRSMRDRIRLLVRANA